MAFTRIKTLLLVMLLCCSSAGEVRQSGVSASRTIVSLFYQKRVTLTFLVDAPETLSPENFAIHELQEGSSGAERSVAGVRTVVRRRSSGEWSARVTFEPRRPGHFRVTYTIGDRRVEGPTITVARRPLGWFAILFDLLTLAILLYFKGKRFCCRKKTKRAPESQENVPLPEMKSEIQEDKEETEEEISASSLVDVACQDRWRRYFEKMQASWKDFINDCDKDGIGVLRRHVLYWMPSEFAYIDIESVRKGQDVLSDFWNCLLYRPDMAQTVTNLLGDMVEVGRPRAAVSLQKVIDVAAWPEHFWSLEQPVVTTAHWPRIIRSVSDALAGIATYGLVKFKSFIPQKGITEIDAQPQFTRERGAALAKWLALCDAQEIMNFFCKEDNRNAFLITAITAAVNGEWENCDPIPSLVPDLPPHYTERPVVFQEAFDLLKEAVVGSQQSWLLLRGPGGAGKTTLSIKLAWECSKLSDVLWVEFGRRSEDLIFNESMNILCDELNVPPMNSPKKFFENYLTAENTRLLTIFVDDVCDQQHLVPFRKARSIIMTSREKVEVPGVKSIKTIEVDLSLTKDQSEELFGKVAEQEVESTSIAQDIRRVLRKVAYNPLAITVLAALLKNTDSELHEEAFKEVEEDLDTTFSDADEKESCELFPSQAERNIFKVLKKTIEKLPEDRQADFDSLIVFPHGCAITEIAFSKFHRNRITSAATRLAYLGRRCIIEQRGQRYRQRIFLMHDLWRECLNQRLTPAMRKYFHARLCEGYFKTGPKIDLDDDFLFLHLVSSCVEAGKVNDGVQLLTSGRFMLERLLRYRSLNVNEHFDAVMQLESGASLECARAFATDLELWHQGMSRKNVLRQAAVLTRGDLDPGLKELATEEVNMPLFEVDGQKEEVEERHFTEASVVYLEDEVVSLALREDDSALVATTRELLALDRDIQIIHRRSFDDRIVRMTTCDRCLVMILTCRRCFLLEEDLKDPLDSLDLESDIKEYYKEMMIATSRDGCSAVVHLCNKKLLLLRVDGNRLHRTEFQLDLKEFDSVVDLALSNEKVAVGLCVHEEGHNNYSILFFDRASNAVDKEMNFDVSSIEFLSEEILLVNNKCHELLVMDWRSEEVLLKSHVVFPPSLRVSPDGRTVVLYIENYSHALFDCQSLQQLLYKEMISCFAISNSVFAFSTTDDPRAVSLLKRLERPLKVIVPRAKLNAMCGVAWIPSLHDFALFFFDDERAILTVERWEGRETILQRPIPEWNALHIRVSAFQNRVGVWHVEGKGVLMLSFEACTPVEEGILDITDGRYIQSLFLLDSHVAIWFRSGAFEVWSQNLDRTIVKENVDYVTASQCGQKLALWFDIKKLIVEYSAEGEWLRYLKCPHFEVPDLCYLLDGRLLAWNMDDGFADAYPPDGTDNQRLPNFPAGVSKVALTEDGRFIFLIGGKQCWVYDISEEHSELVVSSRIATRDQWSRFESFAVGPDAGRVFLQCRDNVALTLHRLDNSVS